MKESLQAMPGSAPAPAGAPVQEGSRSSGSVVKMIVAGILAFLMLVFNIIFLAGVGASESKCKSAGRTNDFCRTEYSLHWWVVFFELICVALSIVAVFSTTVKREIGSGLQAWLAVNTALLAYLASLYNSLINQDFKDVTGPFSEWKSASQAAMAGAVVLSIANLLYIMVLGSSYAPHIERPSRPLSSSAAPAPVYMQEMPPQHVAYNMQPQGQPQDVGGVMNYNNGMPQQGYPPQPTYNMPQHNMPQH